MTLLSLLKEFPNISLATVSDNKEILEYYHRSQLTTSSHDIIYKRGEDFFSFMKEKSSKYLVFLLRDDTLAIQGMASISYRDGYINSKLVKVGYLGDLRVSLNRKLIRQWRNFYSKLILESCNMKETFHCGHYQTALVHDNSLSRNNLVNSKIKGIKYQLLEDYHMINIVGSYGFKRANKFVIDKLSKDNFSELLDFLERDQVEREFGINYKFELPYRLKNWENFQESDWIIIRNSVGGEVLAATSAWGPKSSKQLLLSDVPLIFKIIKLASKFIPFLKVYDLPESGTPIKIKYINQISFKKNISRNQKGLLFKDIANYYYNLNVNLNLLAYCDYDRECFKKELGGLLFHETPMGLYSVHTATDSGVILNEVSRSDNMPSFDMALV